MLLMYDIGKTMVKIEISLVGGDTAPHLESFRHFVAFCNAGT